MMDRRRALMGAVNENADYKFLYGEFTPNSNSKSISIPLGVSSASEILFIKVYIDYSPLNDLKTEENAGLLICSDYDNAQNPINYGTSISRTEGLVYLKNGAYVFDYFSNYTLSVSNGNANITYKNAYARPGFTYKWVAIVSKQ